MEYQIADPLIKLFKDSTLPQNNYTAETVRGEVASLQIALRAEKGTKVHLINPVALAYKKSSLTGTMNFVDFVPVRQNTPNSPMDEIDRPAPALFPDPILEEEKIEIPSGEICPIWVTIPILQDQEPGIYRGMANIVCGQAKLACELTQVPYIARLHDQCAGLIGR